MELMTPQEIMDWLKADGQTVIVIAGLALALLLSTLVWRRVRKSSIAKIGRFVSGPLVLGWEAQGVFQIGHQMLGLPWFAALVGSGLTASVLIALGAQAHEHWLRHRVLGPSGRLMLYVAVPMGLIVALSAHSGVEVGLRIVLPLLDYLVFRSQYMPDEPAGAERKRGSWIWTPHRIGVALGLVDPTDADITTVHRERQVRLLVKLSRNAHHATRWRGWHKRRLQRHAELADAEMMAEVVERRNRAELVMELTDPATTAEKLADLARQARARRNALMPAEAETRRTDPAEAKRPPQPPPSQRAADDLPEAPVSPAPAGPSADLWTKRQTDIQHVDKQIPDWLTRARDLSAGDVLRALTAAHAAGDRDSPTAGNEIQLEIAKAMNETRRSRHLQALRIDSGAFQDLMQSDGQQANMN